MLGTFASVGRCDSLDVGSGQPRIALYLPRVNAVPERSVDTVSLMVQTKDAQLAGFDLKFGCESPWVSIVNVLPGEVPDSCKWEYFHARDISDPTSEAGPKTLWKVVALAKSSPGPDTATCYGLDRRAGLVDLVLEYKSEAFVSDTAVPLYFYWEECRDNVIADKAGRTAMLSNQVYSYCGGAMEQGDGFPSRTGAPRQCVDMTKTNYPRRVVDFHNGGIAFAMIGEPVVDTVPSSSDSARTYDPSKSPE